MEVVDVVIESATVVTMDGRRRVLEDAAIAIRGDWIVALGPTAEVRATHRAETTVDARRSVVLPGMVDLYAHSGGSFTKCLGELLDGAAWRDLLDEIGFRHAGHRFWYLDSQLHALERLHNGCTMMLTQPGVSHARMDDPAYARQLEGAFQDLGIRARIIAGIARAPWPQTYREQVDGGWVERRVEHEQCLDTIEELIGESRRHPQALIDYSTGASRIGNPNPVDPMYDPAQARYVRRQSERLREIMDRYQVGFWCHAYGNAIEYAQDNELGLLTSRSILSHCTGISRRAIEILAETGTRVNHCPRARRIVSYRQDCPVPELLEAGVIVGLGGDAPYIDRSGDPFLDMQAVMRLQRHRFGDASVIPPGKALEMATIDSQRALGLDGELGSIEVGKKADVVVVDTFTPRLWPLTTPVPQVVYCGAGGDVRHVFVNGRQVIRDGRSTQIDEVALLEEVEEEMGRLLAEEELGLGSLRELPEGFWGRARPAGGAAEPAPRWQTPDRYL